MLVMALLPFVDLRSFLPGGDAFVLKRPSWPLPIVGHEFVRTFGVVRPYPGGGIMPWTGEDYFCDASRAIVLAGNLRSLSPGQHLHSVSRRLFTNGVVCRAEIEIHTPKSVDRKAVAAAVGQLPVRVGTGPPKPLLTTGSQIARRYGLATCPVSARRGGLEIPAEYLAPGLPLIVTERGIEGESEWKALRREGASLGMMQQWSLLDGVHASLWSITHDPSATAGQVRRARRHAVRLHCELESFASILRACGRGILDISESPALREYLYSTSKRVLKPTYDGLPNSEVLRAIASSREDSHEGELYSLKSVLESLGPGAARMIYDATELMQARDNFERVLTRREGVVIMNDNSINIGANASVQGVVGHKNKIKDSTFGEANRREVESLSKKLLQEIIDLGLGQESPEAQMAQEIAEEAQSSSPDRAGLRKKLRSILDGVKRFGEAALPVVETINKITSLIG